MTREIGTKQKPRIRGWIATHFSRQKFHEDFTSLARLVIWWLTSENAKFGPMLNLRPGSDTSALSKKWRRRIGRYMSDSDVRPPFPPLRPSLIVMLGGVVSALIIFFSSFEIVAIIAVIAGVVFVKRRQARRYKSHDQRADEDLRRMKGKAHDERHQRAQDEVRDEKRRTREIDTGTRIIGKSNADRTTKSSDVIDWD